MVPNGGKRNMQRGLDSPTPNRTRRGMAGGKRHKQRGLDSLTPSGIRYGTPFNGKIYATRSGLDWTHSCRRRALHTRIASSSVLIAGRPFLVLFTRKCTNFSPAGGGGERARGRGGESLAMSCHNTHESRFRSCCFVEVVCPSAG